MILQGSGNDLRRTGATTVDYDYNRIIGLFAPFFGGKLHFRVFFAPFGIDDHPVAEPFADEAVGQDQRVVESQRPAEVPVDLAQELHLTFDKVAVAYRRALGEHGLA